MNSNSKPSLRDRAHSIRNDLAIISGYASLLATAENLNAAQQVMVQKMADRAVALAQELQHVLDALERASPGQ